MSIESRLALLRTHPTSRDRQKALEQDMEGALKLWKEHLPLRKKQFMAKKLAERKEKEEKQEEATLTNASAETGAGDAPEQYQPASAAV